MSGRIARQLLVPLAVLVQAGCTAPAPEPTDDGDVAEPAPAGPVVATVEVTGSFGTLVVGDVVTLTAVARDAAGHAVADAPIEWSTSSDAILSPLGGGQLEARGEGFALVYASSGAAQSEPRPALVRDPEFLASDSARVAIVEAMSERGLTVVAPAGASAAAQEDGSVLVDKALHRNQLVQALAPDGRPLLLAVLSGQRGGHESETEVTLDFATTALSLVFLQPGVAHRHPSALFVVRHLLAEDPSLKGFAQTLAVLSANDGHWLDHPEVVRAELEAVTHALYARVSEHLDAAALRLAGKADGASISPPSASGIDVSVTRCDQVSGEDAEVYARCSNLQWSKSYAVLKIANTYARWVFSWLVPKNTTAGAVIGPVVNSPPTIVPSWWQLVEAGIQSGISGENRFAGFLNGASQDTYRTVNVDPDAGGVADWYLYSYGPAFSASNAPPGLGAPDAVFWSRFTAPAGLTVFTEIILNVVSVLGYDVPLEADTVYALLQDVTIEVLEGGKTLDVLDTIITFIVNGLIDAYADSFPSLAKFFNALGKIQAGAVIGITLFHLAVSHSEELFVLRGNITPVIEPTNGILPTAYIGCPYEATFRLVSPDPDMSYQWVVSTGTSDAGKWDTTPTPQSWGKDLVLETEYGSPITKWDAADDGLIHVTVTVEEHKYDTTWSYIATAEPFEIPVSDGKPLVGAVSVDPDPAEPGATVTITVEAAHCDPNIPVTGTVEGPGIVGSVTLQPVEEGTLQGTAQLRAAADDSVPLGLVASITSGGVFPETVQVPVTVAVANVGPSPQPLANTVVPGGSFTLRLAAYDKNYVDRPSEILEAVVFQQPSAFAVTPDPLAAPLVPAPLDIVSAPGILVLESALLYLPAPHPDNDGSPGTAPSPYPIWVRVTDDNGLTEELTVPVTVANVAPVVSSSSDVLSVVASDGPLDVLIDVTDDNGVQDIGGLEILGPAHGFTLSNTSVSGVTRTWWYSVDPAVVVAECAQPCTVTFQATDTDDGPENAGVSEPFVLLVGAGDGTPCDAEHPCPTECLDLATRRYQPCEAGACGPWIEVGCAIPDEMCDDGDGQCKAFCTPPSVLGCPQLGTFCSPDGGAIQEYDCVAEEGADLGLCELATTPCPAELQCQAGSCEPPCVGDDDCKATCEGNTLQPQTCQAGKCLPGGAAVPCPAGLVCNADGGTCAAPCDPAAADPVAACPGGGAAVCDGAIAKGWQCLPAGICDALEVDCNDPALCWLGECIEECDDAACEAESGCVDGAAVLKACQLNECVVAYSEDCAPSGMLCDPAGFFCYAPCSTDTDCLEDASLETSCDADSPELAHSWECQGGICVPAETLCSDQAQVCEAGACVEPCLDISDCSGCDANEAVTALCQGGHCVDPIALDCGEQTCHPEYGFCYTACAAPGPDPACDAVQSPSCQSDELLESPVCKDEAGVLQCGAEQSLCEAGEVCDGGACEPKCAFDLDCPLTCSGWVSQIRECDEVTGKCQVTSSFDCAPFGEICHSGICVAPCLGDDVSTCPGGGAPACSLGELAVWACLDGGCFADTSECTVGAACDAGECKATCDTPGEPCPGTCAGNVAEARDCSEDGLCELLTTLDCGVDACVGGACIPGACCLPHGGSGCLPASCSDVVCADLPECCSAWSAACVEKAKALCAGGCPACLDDPTVCDDTNTCTVDSCDPSVGCQNVPNDGVPCDDGDPNTLGDSCAGSVCVGVDCDDGDPCTDDLYTPTEGCLHPAKCPAGPLEIATCVDGACTYEGVASYIIGCADGTREGFDDMTATPFTAACAGGWTEHDFVWSEAYQNWGTPYSYCNRQAGNDSLNPTGQGCGATDLCAPGWFVCDAYYAGRTTMVWGADGKKHYPGCDALGAAPGQFFMSSQKGQEGTCYFKTFEPFFGDVFGCGGAGVAPVDCVNEGQFWWSVDDPRLDKWAGPDCSALPAPWQCETHLPTSQPIVTKPGPQGGGVLCCSFMPEFLPEGPDIWAASKEYWCASPTVPYGLGLETSCEHIPVDEYPGVYGL